MCNPAFLLSFGSFKEQKVKEEEKEEKEENKSEPEKAEYVSFLYMCLRFSLIYPWSPSLWGTVSHAP